ncbi:histidine phosphatase family protein [Macrococcus animalis]|uniref:histidine phosphatase family protein n=1 Tax=Macrococcus animalis TaxID=3395467 RepID=UPI0039BDCCE3
MKLYLARHGQDTLDKRGGWSEEPLIAEGVVQIISLSKSLKQIHFDAVISSDIMRTRQTAEILKDRLSLKEIIFDSGLREVNNGVLAGMDNDQALTQFPDLFWNSLAWDEPYPGGESPKAFFERINRWYKTFIEIYHSTDTVLVITHQGVIDALLCIIHNKTFTNRYVHFKIRTGQFIVVEVE